MTRYFAVGVFAPLCLWASGAAAPADEPTPARPAAGDEKAVVASRPTKAAPAAAVPFRKELGLPYPSLGTLGARVDAARRAGDPVTLAHAASELAVAETVAGKSASLTSRQLLAESAELASVRRQEAELRGVLAVAQQLRAAQTQVTDLKTEIAAAQAETKAQKLAMAAKEEPTGKPRAVVVNNYSTQHVDVQVNGYLKGQVPPGVSRTFAIDQRWNPIVLKGWGDADECTFGPVVLRGAFDKYTWDINDDDAKPTGP